MVEDVVVHDIVMTDVLSPIVMNLYYTCGAKGDLAKRVADPEPHEVSEETPVIRRISLRGITARRAAVSAGCLIGLPESPITDVALRDVDIDTVGGGKPTKAAMSFYCPPTAGTGLLGIHTRNLALDNVNITAAIGPELDIRHTNPDS